MWVLEIEIDWMCVGCRGRYWRLLCHRDTHSYLRPISSIEGAHQLDRARSFVLTLLFEPSNRGGCS